MKMSLRCTSAVTQTLDQLQRTGVVAELSTPGPNRLRDSVDEANGTEEMGVF